MGYSEELFRTDWTPQRTFLTGIMTALRSARRQIDDGEIFNDDHDTKRIHDGGDMRVFQNLQRPCFCREPNGERRNWAGLSHRLRVHHSLLHTELDETDVHRIGDDESERE